MSYVVTFKTDNFVLMAGDKRETFVDGSGYIDGCKKVYKVNDYLYGFTGSTTLSNIYKIAINESKNFTEVINLTDKFFDMLEDSKKISKNNWIKQKFTITIQIAGVVDNKTYLYVYQSKWNEEGFDRANYKELNTNEIPCHVSPLNSNQHECVTQYIINNHPSTIEKAKEIVKELMEAVNNVNIEVSPIYDLEFLEIK